MVIAKVALHTPCLCLVTDRKRVPEGTLAERVAQAVAGGVSLVIVREKDMAGGALLSLVREVRGRLGGRTPVVVNERVDVAMAAHADGVHLGEEGLPVAEARRLARESMLIGRSVHSVEGARLAEREGASYLLFGTVFESASHPGERPQGIAALREVVEAVRVPVLAIGGVTKANVAEVMATGAAGAAVIAAMLEAEDVSQAARELVEAMGATAGAGTR